MPLPFLRLPLLSSSALFRVPGQCPMGSVFPVSSRSQPDTAEVTYPGHASQGQGDHGTHSEVPGEQAPIYLC